MKYMKFMRLRIRVFLPHRTGLKRAHLIRKNRAHKRAQAIIGHKLESMWRGLTVDRDNFCMIVPIPAYLIRPHHETQTQTPVSTAREGGPDKEPPEQMHLPAL